MLGACPVNVLLVGIFGECFEPGSPISAAVRQAVPQAIDAVLRGLERLGFDIEKQLSPDEPAVWWNDNSYPAVHL